MQPVPEEIGTTNAVPSQTPDATRPQWSAGAIVAYAEAHLTGADRQAIREHRALLVSILRRGRRRLQASSLDFRCRLRAGSP